MVDPQVAWDKLAQFESSEELRLFFNAEEITGVIGHASQCPIATWMREATGYKVVTVGGSIKVWGDGTSWTDFMQFPHTPASSEFINRFDHGNYPELSHPQIIFP